METTLVEVDKQRCSMFEDDSVRIRHILDAAREAVAFSQGRSRADLDTDRRLNLSLVRLLEIIGEAARELLRSR